MGTVKEPAVAGYFYPKDKDELSNFIDYALNHAHSKEVGLPKAIIAPHAGYQYSGQVAAEVYKTLITGKKSIKRVILLGPAHTVPFRGIAGTNFDYFKTPLGEIEIDKECMNKLMNLEFTGILEEAFTKEHCLEVQLPFLQKILDDFKIVPLIVGAAEPIQVQKIIEEAWGGPETLIVISSDLSHYHPYEVANKKDINTSKAIVMLRSDKIDDDGACGRLPIKGMLLAAKNHGMTVTMLDLKNSGDTAGDKSRVVGYGAYHIL